VIASYVTICLTFGVSMFPYMIIGVGGHASSVYDLLQELQIPEIFFCTDQEFEQDKLANPIYKLTEVLKNVDDFKFVLGLGEMEARGKFLKRYESSKMNFPAIIHPRAYVSRSAKVGIGSIVFANSYLGPNVEVGEFTIINTNTVVEHGSKISSFSILSPSVTIAGNVEIGNGTFVGMAASISQNVSIESDCVIGANSFVNSTIPQGSLAFGTPAKCEIK
jgi:sugar O-acyltransferase (sialic acid O-acetyltransferase NeuD family)